jgi:hypothetical protein
VGKFTFEERSAVKSIVATLSIKRLSDNEIIESIYNSTKKMITRKALYDIRQSIKKDSYQWYRSMREDSYSYLHEFKERINEIQSLQKMHHELIENNKHNPPIQQTSLAELHRLSITLSNLLDVLPTIINNYGPSISTASEDQTPSDGTEITV